MVGGTAGNGWWGGDGGSIDTQSTDYIGYGSDHTGFGGGGGGLRSKYTETSVNDLSNNKFSGGTGGDGFVLLK